MVDQIDDHVHCKGSTSLVATLSEKEKQELLWRAGIPVSIEVDEICQFHKKKFLENFSANQNCCADPFDVHTKYVKFQLREVDLLDSVDALSFLNKNIVPGTKLCNNCRIKLSQNIAAEKSKVLPDLDEEETKDTLSGSFCTPPDCAKEEINGLCSSMNLSPVVNKHRESTNISHGKRKLDDITNHIERKMKKALQLDPNIDLKEDKENSTLKEDLDILMAELKRKIDLSSSFSFKAKLLTLVPESWSLDKMKSYFGVSGHLCRKAN